MKVRLSLRVWFAGLIVGLLVLVFGAITVVRVHQNRQALQNELADRTGTVARLTADTIVDMYRSTGNSPQLRDYLGHIVALDRNLSGVALIGNDGQSLYSYGQEPPVESGFNSSSYYQNGDLQSLILPQNDGSIKAIAYQVSDATVRAGITKQLRSIVLFSVIGTVAAATAVFAAINQSVIRPIKRLTKQAQRISHGDYSGDLHRVKRHDEIGSLARSMNHMQTALKTSTQKINGLDDAKSEFMMIASHTLRTPITVIKGSLDAISSEEDLDESLRKLIDLAQASTQRLTAFTEDLLVVSNLEVGDEIIRLNPLPLDGVFDMLISYAQTLATQHDIQFKPTVVLPAGCTVRANRPYLTNAVWNLIENALKFTAPYGEVSLSVEAVAQQLKIEVSDTGIGIHEAELEKIFDKMHRGTSTEQYDYDGSGIGLYVSKQIVKAHKGSITVHSRLGQGATFTIMLPLTSTD